MTIIRNISILIIRNHKLDKKRKDVNKFIKKKMSQQKVLEKPQGGGRRNQKWPTL